MRMRGTGDVKILVGISQLMSMTQPHQQRCGESFAWEKLAARLKDVLDHDLELRMHTASRRGLGFARSVNHQRQTKSRGLSAG
ncbi:hypothetical protein E4U41_003190 [Claviceps citrina]|nr:hypothetical protein E4U41_003190 [Claviceps citrina]